MRAYVLAHVEMGQERQVVQALKKAAGVRKVDFTFGPYDVIAEVEAPDLASIGFLITDAVRCAPGVTETLTCLTVE